MSKRLDQLLAKIREYALTFPEAYDEIAWEKDRLAKVNKKTFVFMGTEVDPKTGFTFSVKLPQSHAEALQYPFAAPTGYGLGKAGWVTIRIVPGDRTPIELLKPWIEESYRAVAPKKLVAKLDAG
jgi:predicted DNA-binding protein (MmcQ/YjbR family)